MRVEYNQIIPLSSGTPPNAVCFNPHKPQIAIGINNQIEEYNVFTRARTNRTRIVTGKITHILFSQTHSYKIVFTDDGTLYVWEEDTNILTTRKAIKKTVACCAVSNLLPFLFYAKSGSKEITMFDLAGNRACGKLDAKKPVIMCSTHPSKHLLVTASSDNSIRVIDYQAQRVIHTLEDFNKVTNSTTNIMSICFHPTSNYILSSGTSGTMLIWGDHSNDPTAPLQLLSKITMGSNDVVSIGFHPWLPFLGVLQSSGDIQYFIVERNSTSSGELSYLQQCNLIKPFNLLDLEKASQTESLPDYAKHQFKWQLKPLNMLFHPKLNLLSFSYSYLLPNTGFTPLKYSIGQVIYSLFDSNDPQCIQYSVVSKHLFNRSHWLNSDTNKEFTYPNKIYLINNQKLRLYSVSLNETSVLSNLPSSDDKLRLYPVKLLLSDLNGILLVLFHYLVSNNNNKKEKILERRLGIIRIKDPNKIIFCDFTDIRDVIISNDSSCLFILHESQDKISKINIKDILSSITKDDKITEVSSIDTKSLKITGSVKIQRIFETPNNQLLYYSVSQKSLFMSLQQDITSVHTNKFTSKEVITQVQCQDHPNLEFVIAIATLSQLFILTPTLDIICSYKHVSTGKTPVIDSIMWIGNSLMFNTCNDIYYLTLDGDVFNLMSISIPYCNLTMLLNDRVIASYLNQQNVELRSIPIGILEPLLMGDLALKTNNLPVFQKLVSVHDRIRVGVNLIKKLDSEGYSDLAFTLIENISAPQIPYQIKFKIALRAQKFEKAFEILLIEKKNVTFSTKAKTELFTYVKELSQICYHYGQLEIVKECYELLEDYYSLLNLYILTNYTAGISSLLERAKRDGNNPLLLAACQRQLELDVSSSSSTANTELFNWPFQSVNTNSIKWSTTDSTIALMSTVALDNSTSKDSSTNPIKPLVLDDIKKYFPLDVSVKTVKSSSSKVLLHRSSKKIRTKTKLEPLKPELITSSTSPTLFPTPLKPTTRKPITIATSTATIRKPLEDLISCAPKKIPKLETIPESPSSTSTSVSSTTTTPRESTDGSSASIDASPRSSTPNGIISETENNNNNISTPVVNMTLTTTTTTTLITTKPVRPPRPSSAAFTLIASTDMSPLVPASSMELDVTSPLLHTPYPAELASQILKNALPKLEKGLFSQSLEEVEKALLVLVESGEPSKYQTEIKYCIAYKLALGLLMDVKRLEKEPSTNDLLAKIGIRTKYLADLPLDPKHRVVCMRMAINKNIDAGNYGIASRLLEILIPKNLPDKSKLEEKLKICKQHFGADGNTPAFICPSCSNEVAAGIVACTCGRKIKFCFKTFELLTEPMYFSCSFCNSTFSTNSIENHQDVVICDLCKYGKLVKIE